MKWGIFAGIGILLVAGGIYTSMPKENEELSAANQVMAAQSRGKKA